jgi:hypothetical protein
VVGSSPFVFWLFQIVNYHLVKSMGNGPSMEWPYDPDAGGSPESPMSPTLSNFGN